MEIGSSELILGIFIFQILAQLIFFWKDIMQWIMPEDFIRIDLYTRTGKIKSLWYYSKGKEKITIKGKKKEPDREYFIKPTIRTYRQSKYFRYYEDNPNPIEDDKPIGQILEENLDMQYSFLKTQFSKLFEEDDDWLMRMMPFIVSFLLGAIIGALGGWIKGGEDARKALSGG